MNRLEIDIMKDIAHILERGHSESEGFGGITISQLQRYSGDINLRESNCFKDLLAKWKSEGLLREVSVEKYQLVKSGYSDKKYFPD